MGTKIETKKGFVERYIDLSVESDSFLSKINALADWKPFENCLKKNIKRGPAAAGRRTLIWLCRPRAWGAPLLDA